jgi:Arc/MetJ family transcription regulator
LPSALKSASIDDLSDADPDAEPNMRTTVTLDDELLEKARFYTGIKETPALIREALKKLIELEASRRLARLGGTMPDAKAAPRRRSKRA